MKWTLLESSSYLPLLAMSHLASIDVCFVAASRPIFLCPVSQVVMLAVPAVMGVASIRVYTVREVTSDGLVAREKVCFCS